MSRESNCTRTCSPGASALSFPVAQTSAHTGLRIDPRYLSSASRPIRAGNAGIVLDMEDDRRLSVLSGERLNGSEQGDRDSQPGH